MRNIVWASFFGGLLGLHLAVAAPVIDGDFDDWVETPGETIKEPSGDAPPLVDLGLSFWRFDQQGLWLQVNASAAANIAQAPRTLSLLIDFQPGGADYRGVSGVDQVLEYSPPQTVGRYGYRTLSINGGVWSASEHRPGYLRTAPTVMSRRYEMLARTPQLMEGARVRLMMWNDTEQDVTDWVRLNLPVTSPSQPRPSLTRAPGSDLRVMVWNTGGERTTEQPDQFAQLVRAIEPDIALLDEVWPTQQTDFLSNPKYHSLGKSGGRQRGLILSRWPMQAVEAFRHLPYPAGTQEMIQSQGSESMRGDLKNMREDGVATHGAIITVDNKRLLLVALDLQCCGDGNNSVQDRLREIQARVIAKAIDEVRQSQGFDQLLVGGDFNLVGAVKPLDILRQSASPALSIAHAIQPDGLSNVTWIRNNNEFPPGRLDYFLFDQGLQQRSGVVFNPGVMSDEQRQQLQLQRDSTDRMSGHQPLVIDLSWQ